MRRATSPEAEAGSAGPAPAPVTRWALVDPAGKAHAHRMTDEAVARIRSLFDELSGVYDPVEVPFFGPIAAGLVQLLAPVPGERALDLGCGTGAATLPLARAVGPTGRVTAVDVADGMIAQLDRVLQLHQLGRVSTRRADAGDPDPDWGSFDIVAASLVLFFLPDPQRALQRWAARLAAGGRLGISTFGDQDPVWKAVDALFAPYLPAQLLDARASGGRGPFADDAGVENLFRTAGLTAVRTVTSPVTVAFDDVDGWRTWSMTTGQRQLWARVPPDRRESFLGQAAELLATARGGSGRIELTQQVRYTLGVAAR